VVELPRAKAFSLGFPQVEFRQRVVLSFNFGNKSSLAPTKEVKVCFKGGWIFPINLIKKIPITET